MASVALLMNGVGEHTKSSAQQSALSGRVWDASADSQEETADGEETTYGSDDPDNESDKTSDDDSSESCSSYELSSEFDEFDDDSRESSGIDAGSGGSSEIDDSSVDHGANKSNERPSDTALEEAWTSWLKRDPGHTVRFRSRKVVVGRNGVFAAVGEPEELEFGHILAIYPANMAAPQVYKLMKAVRRQIRTDSTSRLTKRTISPEPMENGVHDPRDGMNFLLTCAHSIHSRGGNDKVAKSGKGERALPRDTKREAAEPKVRRSSTNRLESARHSKKKKYPRPWVKNSRENTRSTRTADCKAQIRIATVGYYEQKKGAATRSEKRKFTQNLMRPENTSTSREHRETMQRCFYVTKLEDAHCGHDFQEDATRQTVTDEHYQLIRTIIGGPPFKTLLVDRARHILKANHYPHDVAKAAVNKAKRSTKTLLTTDMTPSERMVTRMANDPNTRLIAVIEFKQKIFEKRRRKKATKAKTGAKGEDAEPESAITDALVPASVADETVMAEAIATNGTDGASPGQGTFERSYVLGKIVVVSDVGQTGLNVFLNSQDSQVLESMARQGMDRYLADPKNKPHATIAAARQASTADGHGAAGAELEEAAAELASDKGLVVSMNKTFDEIAQDRFPASTERILTQIFFAKRTEIIQAIRYPEVIQRDSTPNTNLEGYSMVMPTGIDGNLRSFTLGTGFMIRETDKNTSFIDNCLAAVTGCAENKLHYFHGNRSLWNDRNASWMKSSEDMVHSGTFGGPKFEPDHGFCSVHLHFLNFNENCKASSLHFPERHHLVFQWLHYRLGKLLTTKERWTEEWKNFLEWVQDDSENGAYPGATTPTAQQARAEADDFFRLNLGRVLQNWAAPFMKRNGTLANRDILRNENEHKLIKDRLAPSNIPHKEQPYATVAVEELVRVAERAANSEYETKRFVSSTSSRVLDQNEPVLAQKAYLFLNPNIAQLMRKEVMLAMDLEIHWIDDDTAVVWSEKFDRGTWIEKFNYGKYQDGNSVFNLLIERTPSTMAPYPALCKVLDGKLHCRKNDKDRKGCSIYQEFGLPCRHMIAANKFVVDEKNFPIRHTIAFASGMLDDALHKEGRNHTDMHLGLEPTLEKPKHSTVKCFDDAMTATVEAWRQAMGIEPSVLSSTAERIEDDDDDGFEGNPPSGFETEERYENSQRVQSDADFFNGLTPEAQAYVRELLQNVDLEKLARNKAAGKKFVDFVGTYDGDRMRESESVRNYPSRGGRPSRSSRKRTRMEKEKKSSKKEKKSSKKGKKDKKRQRT